MSESAETEQQIQPIQYWFVLNRANLGFAPEEVGDEFLGLPLPSRRSFSPGNESFSCLDPDTGLETHRVVEDGIAIEVDDAISALRLLGRDKAATWWEEYCGQQNKELVFDVSDGYAVVSLDIERRFPELRGLDDSREAGSY